MRCLYSIEICKLKRSMDHVFIRESMKIKLSEIFPQRHELSALRIKL